MLQRLISRINSAHVIATIALFAALGGGYAMAFVGSGQLQKGHKSIISDSPTFDTVRSVDGIGSVQATCDDVGAAVDRSLTVRFRNTSGERVLLTSVKGSNGAFNGAGLDNNTNHDEVIEAGQADTIRYHVLDENEKAPQADILVTAGGPDADNGIGCDRSFVSVLVLNTQE